MQIELIQYNSINEVPGDVWNALASREAVSLETAHLRAIEESQINNICPYYFIGYHEGVPVGIAYCFSISINFAKLANSYPNEILETIKAWNPDFMEMRMLEVGHIASLGSTIEVKLPFVSEFLQAFTDKIEEIARTENADVCLIRDITTEQYCDFQSLKTFGYRPVMGFPIARIPVSWKSFDGYIDALKNKKRSNILQKPLKLNVPEMSVEVIEDYAPYAERLTELWTNVAKRNNGYAHEQLTPAYFEAMARNLKGRSNVTAIKKDGEIVAYGLNLVGDTELFGMAEGLDYSVRDEYDLYANNIFESLRMACELGKKSFNVGITTYDYKASIGAELQPCVYFIKSFRNPLYTSVFEDLIKKNIDLPDNEHRVFRDSDITNRVQLKNVKEALLCKELQTDPFTKLYNHVRVDTARLADMYTLCPVFESAQEPVIQYEGREVIMLGTNAYLGLATHPKVKKAAHDAIDKYGSGCSGSPMLNGTLDIHKELREHLAWFMGKQDALVFSTGYQTNVGAISALVNRNDVLIMDERNHASLVDGAILSRANVVRYKHNSIDSLESVLKRYADKPKLLVTDTIFSMEGTIIDLPAIVALCKKYNSRLMLDESHAIGVMGPTGRGVAEHFGLLGDVDIVMGTFSKSLASVGGFIAGERKIIDTLRHTSRAHIFSASLPPSAVATVLAALQIIDNEPERRTRLLANARFLAAQLQILGFQASYHGGAIVTIHCGHELIAIAAYKKLLEKGVYVNVVPSPAVPKKHELLRISLMATHSEEILKQALSIFESVKTPYWPKL